MDKYVINSFEWREAIIHSYELREAIIKEVESEIKRQKENE